MSYISQFMTLLPGVIVGSDAPAGVGMGFDPPRFLRVGDLVEHGIEGFDSIIQRVILQK